MFALQWVLLYSGKRLVFIFSAPLQRIPLISHLSSCSDTLLHWRTCCSWCPELTLSSLLSWAPGQRL